jgi:hypothetical protein
MLRYATSALSRHFGYYCRHRGGRSLGVSPIRAANLEFTLETDRDRCTNFVGNRGCAYFDLIVAASSARFFCHASYSGVPRRGGTSFGIPPSHVGTLSATTPLTAGLGSVAQAGSIMQAMAASAGLVALNFMTAITRPNHA